jgi:hypothetical protein
MRVECLQRARPKTGQQWCRRWDWLTRGMNRVCLSTWGISQGEKQLERRSKINRSEKKRTITVSQHWIGVKFMHGQVQHTLYQVSTATALVEGIYQKGGHRRERTQSKVRSDDDFLRKKMPRFEGGTGSA